MLKVVGAGIVIVILVWVAAQYMDTQVYKAATAAVEQAEMVAQQYSHSENRKLLNEGIQGVNNAIDAYNRKKQGDASLKDVDTREGIRKATEELLRRIGIVQERGNKVQKQGSLPRSPLYLAEIVSEFRGEWGASEVNLSPPVWRLIPVVPNETGIFSMDVDKSFRASRWSGPLYTYEDVCAAVASMGGPGTVEEFTYADMMAVAECMPA